MKRLALRARAALGLAWLVLMAIATALPQIAQAATPCVPYQATVSSGYYGRAAGNSPEEACQAIVALFPKPLFMNGGTARSTVTYVGVKQITQMSWHCRLNYYTTRVSDGAFMPNESGERLLDGVGGPICLLSNPEITLAGGKLTKALPAGPALAQVATVRQGSTPVAGRSVTIRADGAFYTSGVTNGAGELHFAFVPPRTGGVSVHLEATCDNCTNTATNDIAVEPCDICGGEGEVGNPIQPATGEKIQRESDWEDASPHPLNVTRTYRSQGRFQAGLGSAWTHNWSARLDLAAGPVLYLPGGTSVLFQASGTGRWLAVNLDTLAASGSGYVYRRASDDSRWEFDSAGRAVRITQRNGWSYQLAYAYGELASVTNAFGRRLSFGHDTLGRLIRVTAPDGTSVHYGYSSDAASARLVLVTYADGRTRRYFHEDPRRPNALTGITDESGSRYASFSYDEKGRAIVSEHAGGVARFAVSYGESGTGSDTPRGGAGTGTTLPRDGSGIPGSLFASATITDPSGAQRSYGWSGGDGNARLVSSNGAFDGVGFAARTLGEGGLPTSETDFNGVVTTHAWDAGRRLKITTTEAAGQGEVRPTTTQWHPGLRLPVQIDERGRSTAYEYDALGNLLTERVTDVATGEIRTRTWTYDRMGLVQAYTDAAGRTWQYTYDAAGNRTETIDPAGARTSTSYDAGGRVLTHAAPGRDVVRLAYDAAGRIAKVTQGLWANTSTHGAAILVQEPVSWNAAYDSRDRLISFARPGAASSFTYDANSNRLTALETQASELDLEGSFDQTLAAESSERTLNVDAASNRLLGFSQTLTGLRGGQVTSTTRLAVSYGVDANGSITSDGLREFVHDASGRLSQVRITRNGEAAAIDYLHNGLGQRVFKSDVRLAEKLPDRKTLGNGFIAWLRSNFDWIFNPRARVTLGDAYLYGDGEIPQWALLMEQGNGSASSQSNAEYIWLPTEDGGAIPIGMHKAGKLFAIHADHLGTPRLVTDSASKPVWQWPYSAFGANKPTGVLQVTTNAAGVRSVRATAPAVEVNLRFPGQYADEETGFFYNYFRNYDPRAGRYVQFDPIGLAGGINGFIYVSQNPLTFIDPDGLQVAIPAPILAPAAGSLARPAAGTLIDPIVTPGAPDPNDPNNNQRCKSLKRRIDKLRDEIYNKRYPDLTANPGNLPQRIGPGEALRDTVRGHEKLLNRQLRRLKELEDQHDKECLC